MPIMPVAKGSRPAIPPAPIRVMATGASIRRANSRNSSWDRLRTTPPPQMSMGFLDWAIISTSLFTSSWLGSGIFRLLVRARRIRLARRPE